MTKEEFQKGWDNAIPLIEVSPGKLIVDRKEPMKTNPPNTNDLTADILDEMMKQCGLNKDYFNQW